MRTAIFRSLSAAVLVTGALAGAGPAQGAEASTAGATADGAHGVAGAAAARGAEGSPVAVPAGDGGGGIEGGGDTGYLFGTDAESNIVRMSPDPYTIQLVKPTTADTKLTAAELETATDDVVADIKNAAAQLTAITGTQFTFSTVYHEPESTCPSAELHKIVVSILYRPMGKVSYSNSYPCRASGNGTPWGGWLNIDSEYWDGSLTMDNYRIRNVVPHELGHIVGLDHPDRDGSDANTTVDEFECVTNEYHDLPLMCSPNGGYAAGLPENSTASHEADGPDGRGTQYAGQYTPWDRAGLEKLVQNWKDYVGTTAGSASAG